MAASGRTDRMRFALPLAAAICAALSAAACAPFGAHDPHSPGWFKSRLKEAEKKPFPTLASVPTMIPNSRPKSDWDAIEKDVSTAGNVLDASPRSAPADQTPEATAAFEAQARKDAEGSSASP